MHNGTHSATPALRSRLQDSARSSRSLAEYSPILRDDFPSLRTDALVPHRDFSVYHRHTGAARLPYLKGNPSVPRGKSDRTPRGRTVLRGKDFRTSREENPYLKGRILRTSREENRLANPHSALPLRNTRLFQNNLKTFSTTNRCCCSSPQDAGASNESRRPRPSRIGT